MAGRGAEGFADIGASTAVPPGADLTGHSSVMGAKGAPNASQPRARATVSESGDNNATAKVTTKKPTGCAAGCNQQKMRSWQPVLTTPWAISIFICVGVFFIVIGIVLMVVVASVVECQVQYKDGSCSGQQCDSVHNITISAENCVGLPASAPNQIAAPLYLYYTLTNFYQSHRRYVRSKSTTQLKGAVITDPNRLKTCQPAVTVEDVYGTSDSRVLSPCGLIAISVFNDTYRVLDSSNNTIVLEEDSIAWPRGNENAFKNPSSADSSKIYEWLNETIFPGKVENPHFAVWMRNSALPSFRKLYAKIETDVELPVTIEVNNRKIVATATAVWLSRHRCGSE
eukprot:GHVU01194451.1.p1 GENE.GHVU01194451.1~~GHVU01194451.1.p1  ORF type:complete len:341 (+),score=57.31 GHVU01194451.1:361-1383(+)